MVQIIKRSELKESAKKKLINKKTSEKKGFDAKNTVESSAGILIQQNIKEKPGEIELKLLIDTNIVIYHANGDQVLSYDFQIIGDFDLVLFKQLKSQLTVLGFGSGFLRYLSIQ